jgi:hypothetical protein
MPILILPDGHDVRGGGRSSADACNADRKERARRHTREGDLCARARHVDVQVASAADEHAAGHVGKIRVVVGRDDRCVAGRQPCRLRLRIVEGCCDGHASSASWLA